MNIQKIKEEFEKKLHQFSYFETAAQAADYLNHEIDKKTVGFGDSQTLKSMGLFELLSSHNEVHSPMHPAKGETFNDAAEAAVMTDVFLTSVNGASEAGEMVNIDGFGNRVAGSLYSHRKVYFVFGINKFAPTLEEAIWRARNIAAPANAKRLGKRTPCAIKGDHCYNCNSPGRICNAVRLYLHKPEVTEVEVVVIGENMGL